ncbi:MULTISPECIES: DUF6471 domain-containing protein [Fusobacterium]|uniref:DUF6471 domain-containing protein n=1 Tax=Fusobacterium TaxID=848 RepID=UPI000B9268C4|nr:DUF6471 domain-containing protein [Fusobacterium sp. oral taxon 203]ASS39550.1 DUF739 domain-containing protein [Fusobacterium sp. oral taxon 203]
MVLTNEIKGKMVARGFTQKQLAEKLEMSERTLANKLTKGVFTTTDVEKLIDILKIENPMEIFFAK